MEGVKRPFTTFLLELLHQFAKTRDLGLIAAPRAFIGCWNHVGRI